MDEAIQSAYKRQYKSYCTTQPGIHIRRLGDPERPQGEVDMGFTMTEYVVNEAIEGLRLQERLRIDARLFLLVSLHQMVTSPMTHGGFDNAPSDLPSHLLADAKTILKAAALATKKGDKITAAHVVRGIALVLHNLHYFNLQALGE